jgi:hypothetical protein
MRALVGHESATKTALLSGGPMPQLPGVLRNASRIRPVAPGGVQRLPRGHPEDRALAVLPVSPGCVQYLPRGHPEDRALAVLPVAPGGVQYLPRGHPDNRALAVLPVALGCVQLQSAKSVEICNYSAKLNILKGALRRCLRVLCEARHSKARARPYAANAGVEIFHFASPQVCSALSNSVRRCSYAYDIRQTITILRDNLS